MKAKRNQVHRFNDALILFFLVADDIQKELSSLSILVLAYPFDIYNALEKASSTARGHTKYKKKRSCISDPFLRPLPYGEMNTT